MNKIFDINRFMYYSIRNLYTTRKQVVAIVAILFALFLLAVILMPIEEGTFGYLFMGFMSFTSVLIVIISPCIMEEKLFKSKAVFSYILPISRFERYLFLILKYMIAIPVISLGVSDILKKSLHIFTDETFLTHLADKSLTFDVLDPNFLFITLAFQSFFILGHFYFKQYTFFKTTGFLIAMLLLVVLIGNTASGIEKPGLDFIKFINAENYTQKWLGETPNVINICSTILKTIFPFGIWFATYFKIRETEI